jgi:hypothetical protein
MSLKLPSILNEINPQNIQRIDAALEGNWKDTVVTVWLYDKGFIGFEKVIKQHHSFKPSIELYFLDTWVGIHCFKKSDKMNIFDEEYAMAIIKFIEDKIKKK